MRKLLGHLPLDEKKQNVRNALAFGLASSGDVDYINDLGQTVQDQVLLPIHLVYTFTTGQGTAFATKDRFSSPPVVIGDDVYVIGESGLIYELPSDPLTP